MSFKCVLDVKKLQKIFDWIIWLFLRKIILSDLKWRCERDEIEKISDDLLKIYDYLKISSYLNSFIVIDSHSKDMKRSGGPKAFAVASIVNNPSPTPIGTTSPPATLKESLPVITRQQSSDVPYVF